MPPDSEESGDELVFSSGSELSVDRSQRHRLLLSVISAIALCNSTGILSRVALSLSLSVETCVGCVASADGFVMLRGKFGASASSSTVRSADSAMLSAGKVGGPDMVSLIFACCLRKVES